MSFKTLTTSKGTWLAVPVEKGAKDACLIKKKSSPDAPYIPHIKYVRPDDFWGEYPEYVFLFQDLKLETDNVEIISLRSQLTEEQAAELVEEKVIQGKRVGYKNYTNELHFTVRALESFDSLMAANNCFLKNPYGEDHPLKVKGEVFEFEEKELIAEIKSFEEARANTSEDYLFIKVVK